MKNYFALMVFLFAEALANEFAFGHEHDSEEDLLP